MATDTRSNGERIKYALFASVYVIYSLSLYYHFRAEVYSESGILRWIILIGIAVFAILAFYVRRSEKSAFDKQFILLCFLQILFTIPLIREYPNLQNHGRYEPVALYSLAILSLGAILISLPKYRDIKGKALSVLSRKSTMFLILLLGITILLNHQSKVYSLWDSALMFYHLDRIKDASALLDLIQLSVFEHTTYTYVFMGVLCKLTFGSVFWGQAVYTCILTLLGVYGFWKLMRCLFPSLPEWETFALTLVYAVSPFVTGMSCYCYEDQVLWLLFPPLMAALYSRKDVYALVLANFYIFSKEPGVISYSLLLFGMYLMDCIKKKKLFHDVTRWLYLLIPSFLWLLSYIHVGHYREGGYVFSTAYTISKMQSFFCVDFHWLIGLIGLTGVLMCGIRKEWRTYWFALMPVLISIFVFLVFSSIFNTDVNHPRYIDAVASQLFILASVVPAVLIRKRSRKAVWYSIGAVLMLVQSFYTIDPVSKLTFPTIQVGTTEMITTGAPLCDGMVYNRQYQNHGYLTDMALEDICTNPDNILCIPAYDANSWFFDGIGSFELLSEQEPFAKIPEYWNSRYATRMIDEAYPGNIPFTLYAVLNGDAIPLEQGQKGYYLYTDYVGSEIAEQIRKEYNVIEERSFERQGWILRRIEFDRHPL